MTQDGGTLLRSALVTGRDVEHVVPHGLPVQPGEDRHQARGHVDGEGGLVPARDNIHQLTIEAEILISSVNLNLYFSLSWCPTVLSNLLYSTL